MKEKILLVIGASALSLACAELAFHFVARSHGMGHHSLAHRNWEQRYWKPINSLGYRDREIAAAQERKQILVVGDSFVAGHGVRGTEMRFSNLLNERFQGKAQVWNVGVNGADTEASFANLLDFPVKPDAIVLSYFGNDIEPVGGALGLHYPRTAPYSDWPLAAQWAIEKSALINFIYWSFPHGEDESYLEFLARLYQTPMIRALHEQSLEKFIQYAQKTKTRLVVVVIPFLHDPNRSEEIYGKWAKHFFSSKNIPTIDVGELVSDLPPSQRVVNSTDTHASEEVHRRIANSLFPLLEK